MTKRLPVSTLTAAAVVLAAPATGHALGGSADRACYTHVVGSSAQQVTQPVNVGLNGGTPGGPFQVVATRSNGQSAGSTSGTFDAAGNGLAQITNLFPSGGAIGPLKGQKLRITVKDLTTSITAPIRTVRLTNLGLSGSAKPRNPRLKRTVRVSGTVFARKRIYGFVTSSNGKRVLDRFRIGRGNVCGYAKRRAVVAPSPFAFGSFRFYASPSRKLKRKRSVFIRFTIRRTIL